MSVTSAINDLIHAVLSVISGILNIILSLFRGVFAVFEGTISASTNVVTGILAFMWNHIGVILLLGMSLLAYQIFVVEKRQGAVRTRSGPKKLK